jgi:hypothetical protein
MREYEEELSKLERAIRDERERQLELMRRHLLKKQLHKEQERKNREKARDKEALKAQMTMKRM